MSKTSQTVLARQRRHERVRERVHGTAERPRLCVFRSLQHIYVQVIDDTQGHTLLAVSTLDAEVQAALNGKAKIAQATAIGELLARRALAAGIKQVVFDRGGYLYHGRVKALAEPHARAGWSFSNVGARFPRPLEVWTADNGEELWAVEIAEDEEAASGTKRPKS